jgi:hypothetical protein
MNTQTALARIRTYFPKSVYDVAISAEVRDYKEADKLVIEFLVMAYICAPDFRSMQESYQERDATLAKAVAKLIKGRKVATGEKSDAVNSFFAEAERLAA